MDSGPAHSTRYEFKTGGLYINHFSEITSSSKAILLHEHLSNRSRVMI
ncbi:hypothetical protein JCM17380_39790 [Desulfosporosinus burensis]